MDKELYGFGGWLIFFTVIFCLLTPLIELVSFALIVGGPESRGFRDTIPNWTGFMASYAVALAAELAIVLFAGYRLMRVYTPFSVRFTIAAIWAIAILFPLLALLLTALFMRIDFGLLFEVSMADDPLGDALSLGWAVLWTAYFLKSRRVENTYYDYAEEPGVEDVFD